MVRRARIIILFLLLGAIVNIAVAWAGACLSDPPAFPAQLIEQPGTHQWPEPVPAHWPEGPQVLALSGLFWRTTRYVITTIELTSSDGEVQQFLLHQPLEFSDGDTISKTETFLIDHYCFGWPMRSMGSDEWEEFVLHGTPPVSTSRSDGHPKSSIWQLGLQTSYGFGVLPLGLRWPAFPVNTLLHGFLLWMVLRGYLSLRRVVRRKRQLCTACAYPLGRSPVCTECGAAVKTA